MRTWPWVACVLALAGAASALITVSSCADDLATPNEIYELNQSISINYDNCLSISADNVTLDCKGYTISGNNAGNAGIRSSTNRTNVTITNCTITNVGYGIFFEGANPYYNITINYTTIYNHAYDGMRLHTLNNCMLAHNNVYQTGQRGILVSGGSNCTLVNNTANNNTQYGIYLDNINYVTMRNNTMNNNTLLGFYVTTKYDEDIDTSNAANGEPLYYYNHADNQVISGLTLTAANTSIGKIIIANSNNATVRDCFLSNNTKGYAVEVVNSNNTNVYNVTSIDNSVGVYYTGSKNGTVGNCTVNNSYSPSGSSGLYAFSSIGQFFKNNIITNVDNGVNLMINSRVWLYGNTITNTPSYKIYSRIGTNVYNVTNADKSVWLSFSNKNTNNSVDFGSAYYVAEGIAAVNSSLNSNWNTSATITIPFSWGKCPFVNLYFWDNYTTDVNEIIANGQLCTSMTTPACTLISCDGTTLTFSVTRFSSYGADGYAVPEFPGAAAVLAIVLAAAGWAAARKRQ
ncbi:MAG: right-handed parallel beta-helix repeat-containing protein [Candidatus Micrarchaeota archaeon]|nr:right-handed parallel beta-helix repeat-containing protein [Candidatus Micrarchaeota archaeon]